jgi:hypothetical protein
MADNLKKANIGQFPGDETADTVRQIFQKFNDNMDEVLSESDPLDGIPGEDHTGLHWDSDRRVLSIDIPIDRLFIGMEDGVSPISQPEIVRNGLSQIGADPSAIARITNDVFSLVAYRETLLSLKQSNDHAYYKATYVGELADELSDGIIPLYYWNSESTEEGDNRHVIKPDGIPSQSSGRWIISQRVQSLGIDLENYIWVSPNGSDDNTGRSKYNPIKSLHLAADKARGSIHATIVLYPGLYEVDTPVELDEFVTLRSMPEAIANPRPIGDESNQVIIQSNVEDQPAVIAKHGCSIEGIIFEGDTNTDYVDKDNVGAILEFHFIGSSGDVQEDFQKPTYHWDRTHVRNCVFRPAAVGWTTHAIRVSTRAPGEFITPLDTPVITCEVSNCRIQTYGGIGILSERLNYVHVKDSQFEFNGRGVSTVNAGMAKVDRCTFMSGDAAVEAVGDSRVRHIGLFDSPASESDQSVSLTFQQSDSIDIDPNIIPKPPVLLQTDNEDFVTVLTDIEGESNGVANCHLRDGLPVGQNEGAKVFILQPPYVELAGCTMWDVGTGNSFDEAVHNIPNAIDTVTNFTTGRGIIQWSLDGLNYHPADKVRELEERISQLEG